MNKARFKRLHGSLACVPSSEVAVSKMLCRGLEAAFHLLRAPSLLLAIGARAADCLPAPPLGFVAAMRGVFGGRAGPCRVRALGAARAARCLMRPVDDRQCG